MTENRGRTENFVALSPPSAEFRRWFSSVFESPLPALIDASAGNALPARACYLCEYWRGKSGSTGPIFGGLLPRPAKSREFLGLCAQDRPWMPARNSGILAEYFLPPPKKRGENSTDRPSPATSQPPAIMADYFPQAEWSKVEDRIQADSF